MASGIASVVVTVGGKTYNLSESSTAGTWTVTGTAPAKSSGSNNNGVGVDVGTNTGGKFVATLVVTDFAGNTTTIVGNANGSNLQKALLLAVKETTLPTISINSPTSGAYLGNSLPTFRWTVSDSGSGVNVSSISIDGGAFLSGVVESASGTNNIGKKVFTYSIPSNSPLPDGSHKFVISATDYDGNTQYSSETSFIVDTTPPELDYSLDEYCIQPTSDYTGNKYLTRMTSCNIAGDTSDESTVTIAFALTNSKVTVQSWMGIDVYSGRFAKIISLEEGTNTLTVRATDRAGKTTDVTKIIVVDSKAPSVSSIALNPNPANANGSFTITISVSDN